MAVVNSFAKFYSASYPATSDVLATAPVYGDAINVLQGTNSGGGACTGYPATTDVLVGITYGDSSQFTGTLDPDSGMPDESKVRSGIVYGSTSQFTGNSQLPVISVVLAGTGYGSNGTEYVGTLQSSGSPVPVYPPVEDVLTGVEFGNVGDVPMVGVFNHADPSIVKLDEQYGAYGTEYYGDLECVEPNPCDQFPPYTPPAGSDCAQGGWLN
jgi:hypothetical protein